MRRVGAWANENRTTLKRFIRRGIRELTGFDVSVHRAAPAGRHRSHALVTSMEPAERRRAIELEYGVFDTATRELHVTHDSGLYSCLSVTLWSLTDLLHEGYVPLKINFSHTLQSYKDEPLQDVYPTLFSTAYDEADVAELVRAHRDDLRRFDHHGEYGRLAFDTLRRLLAIYLRPNDIITERTRLTEQRYIAPGQRYLGVCYRGTDKGTEIIPLDSSVYLELAERLLAERSVDRVLIQTDQEQVSQLFRRTLGERCDIIEKLPRTRGTVAIHLGDAIAGSRLDFTLDMMAAVNILSKMEQVIVYTGNIGAWIALIRGSGRGVWQATPEGISPQWRDAAVPTS